MTRKDVVVELVEKLAAAEGRKPTELPYNLSEQIDPVVLQTVVTAGTEDSRLTFSVPNHRVTVTGTGKITIERLHSEATGNDITRLDSVSTPSMTMWGGGDQIPFDNRFLDNAQSFPDLCFVFDEDAVYRDIMTKPHTTDLLYAEPSTLLDSSVHEVLPSAEASVIADAIETTLDSDGYHSYSYELSVPLGPREFMARSYSLSDTDGSGCVLLTVSDVTEEKKMISQLTN